jgi:hypothetical protein
MTPIIARKCALLGLLLAGFAAAAEVDSGAPAVAPVRFDAAVAAMASDPAKVDYRALWQDFLARGDRDASYDAQAVFADYDSPFAPSDQECADTRERLATALALAPVSLAAHLVAGACSDDEPVAAAHAAAIRGLLQALQRPQAGRSPQQPWRVYSRWDAEALIHALGYTVKNRSLQVGDYLDMLPMAYLVQAPDERFTRIVYVDYFDSYARLIERDGLDAHPLTRMQMLFGFAASGIRGEEPPDSATRSADVTLKLQAGMIDVALARTSLLEVREHDHAALAKWWISKCLAKVDPASCPEGDIDLLLDDAEFGEPFALALLALLHASGTVVDADSERALGLYQRLREVHEPGAATIIVGSLLPRLPSTSGGELAKRVVADLIAVREEQPQARVLLGNYARLGDAQAAALGSAAEQSDRAFEAGYGPAGLVRVGEWLKDPRDRQRAIERLSAILADWSQPFAAYTLAQLLRAEARYDEAQPLVAAAARAGHAPAMRLYADEYLGPDADAERVASGRALLQAAWQGGEPLALIDLVESYEGRIPADRSELDSALQELEHLSAKIDSPVPKLALGRALIEGLGGAGREGDGLRQVRRAQRGDYAEAWLYEHQLLLDGRIGRNTARARNKLLEGALAASDTAGVKARVGAFWYADPDSEQARQDRGLALMLAAESAGRTYVLNDAAWRLCKGGDAARGLPLAQRALAAAREAATLDTVAACQAQAGDHADAVASQQQALDLAETDQRYGEARRAKLRQRLVAYQEGRVDFSD